MNIRFRGVGNEKLQVDASSLCLGLLRCWYSVASYGIDIMDVLGGKITFVLLIPMALFLGINSLEPALTN